MCSADRPESYTVPGSYRPDTLELRRIQQEKEAIRQYQQVRHLTHTLSQAPADLILPAVNKDVYVKAKYILFVSIDDIGILFLLYI